MGGVELGAGSCLLGGRGGLLVAVGEGRWRGLLHFISDVEANARR